jgi:hypothetical protein
MVKTGLSPQSDSSAQAFAIHPIDMNDEAP